ncbi:hypothetical protein BYT27DRAFT_7263064 [Phlegmacium glaucopus]|nr:hypothetical protein BYT27DRAFT_7263064 [Phlegmacium glaucopus]
MQIQVFPSAVRKLSEIGDHVDIVFESTTNQPTNQQGRQSPHSQWNSELRERRRYPYLHHELQTTYSTPIPRTTFRGYQLLVGDTCVLTSFGSRYFNVKDSAIEDNWRVQISP